MFNVCPQCGEYSEEKSIDPNGPVAIYPYCGHRHPFMQLHFGQKYQPGRPAGRLMRQHRLDDQLAFEI